MPVKVRNLSEANKTESRSEFAGRPLPSIERPIASGVKKGASVHLYDEPDFSNVESFLKHQENKNEKNISRANVTYKDTFTSEASIIERLERDIYYNDGEDKVVFPLEKRSESLGLFQADCRDPSLVAWLEYHSILRGKARQTNVWYLNPKYHRCDTEEDKVKEFERALNAYKIRKAKRIKVGQERYSTEASEKRLMVTAVASGFGRYRGLKLQPQSKDVLRLINDSGLFLEKHLRCRGVDGDEAAYGPSWFVMYPGSYGNRVVPGYSPQARFENIMSGYYNQLAKLSDSLRRKGYYDKHRTDKAASEEDQSPKLASNSSDKPAIVEEISDCKATLHDELFWSTFNNMTEMKPESGYREEITDSVSKVLPRSRLEVCNQRSSITYLLPRFTKGARKRERQKDHLRSVRREQWLNVFKHLYYLYPNIQLNKFFGKNGLGDLYRIPGAYKPECLDWVYEQCLSSSKIVESHRKGRLGFEVSSILDEIRFSLKHREEYRDFIESVNSAGGQESGCESAPASDIIEITDRKKQPSSVIHNIGPYILTPKKSLVSRETEFLGELYHSILGDMVEEQHMEGPPRPLILNEGMLYFGKNKSALVHECGKLIINEDGSRSMFHPGGESVEPSDIPLWQEAMSIAKKVFSFLKANNGKSSPLLLVNKIVIDGVEYMVPVKLPEFVREKVIPDLK